MRNGGGWDCLTTFSDDILLFIDAPALSDERKETVCFSRFSNYPNHTLKRKRHQHEFASVLFLLFFFFIYMRTPLKGDSTLCAHRTVVMVRSSKQKITSLLTHSLVQGSREAMQKNHDTSIRSKYLPFNHFVYSNSIDDAYFPVQMNARPDVFGRITQSDPFAYFYLQMYPRLKDKNENVIARVASRFFRSHRLIRWTTHFLFPSLPRNFLDYTWITTESSSSSDRTVVPKRRSRYSTIWRDLSTV